MQKYPVLVSCGLGVLSALALPPFFVLPVLWVAVPGLLVLIDHAQTWRRAALIGFVFGFGFNLLGLYWITEAILVEAARYWWLIPFAVPAISLVLAVFTASACGLAFFARPGLPRLLALAGLWTLSDLARQFALTGFPWNLWGTDWTLPGNAGTVFIQPAAWVGVHGLTLATFILAGLPVLGRRGWIAALSGLALWAAVGFARLSGPHPKSQNLTTVVVQGDVKEGQKWNMNLALSIFRRYLRLTAQGVAAAGSRPVAVIWPETASPFPLASDAAARAAVAAAAGPGVPVLAGTVRFDRHNHPRNSLVVVDGPGPILAHYDKWHLVPFGEYVPSWLPIPVHLVPNNFTPGPGPRTISVPGLPPFGPFICYEDIFTGEIIDEQERPAWMVNITNDAWFGNTTGPRQHLADARLRSVEEGLPLVRAANTGISAVFSAYGQEVARLGLDKTGDLITRLPGALPPTLYARYGLWIPLVLSMLSVAIGFVITS